MFRSRFIPLVIATFIVGLVFWPVFILGKAPFPGNLLVGRFFPYESETLSNKVPEGSMEFIAADAVRQTYPWRKLSIEQLKQGELPWWNPYTFSGSPLLANMQSAPFYPLNILYLEFEFNVAWVIQVLMQPFLALLFTYGLARSWGQSRAGSWISAIGFAFSGYLMVWWELNTVGHAGLWLPLSLWLINLAHKQPAYYLGLSMVLAASILANHLQTSLYLVVATIFYFGFVHFQPQVEFSRFKKHTTRSLLLGCLRRLFRALQDRRLHILSLLGGLGLTGVLTAIQLIPGLSLVNQSARSGQDRQIFELFLMPWSHLVKLVSPNYFGQPANNTYFGAEYGEFMIYTGLTVFVLSLVGASAYRKSKTVLFLCMLAVFSLVFALQNPIAYIPHLLSMPILESSSPARILFLFQFAIALLAGFGADLIQKRPGYWAGAVGGVFLVLLAAVLYRAFAFVITDSQVIRAQAATSIKQSLPYLALTSALLAHSYLNYFKTKWDQFRPMLVASLVFLGLAEYTWFNSMYQPYSNWEFVSPNSEMFDYVSDQPGYYRFFGDYTASVMSNIWMPHQLLGVEGYDSLYLRRYGQLIAAAAHDGQLPARTNRSDANLKPNSDDFYRRRLQDVLGVKHILDKQEFFEPGVANIERFDPARYELVWEQGDGRVYANKQVIPRAYLVFDYEVYLSDDQLLARFYDPQWKPQESVLLEQAPDDMAAELTETPSQTVEILEYKPNQVKISVETRSPGWLVLSDAFESKWQALVDGQATPIYRANFAFRAIQVPAGTSLVEYRYRGLSGWLSN